MRISKQLQMVVRVMLADPDREWWGFELGKATCLPSGTVYPMLERMLAEGWLVELERESERVAAAAGRPPRRRFRVVEAKVPVMERALEWVPKVGRLHSTGRLVGDGGASLPEYALIVAVLVLAVSVAADGLGESSEEEMRESSSCIGNPYQPSCDSGVPGGPVWTEAYP